MAAFPTASIRTKNWSTETLTDADLEGQLDLIHTWVNAMANSSTGHKHDGTTSEGPKILASNIGTGAYPAANVAAITNMLELIYPVGMVVTLGVSTNPGTLFGVGTWAAIEGRVIVGIDSGTFDLLDEELGVETVTLTAAQSGLPSHTHTFPMDTSNDGGTSGEAVNSNGAGTSSTPATSDVVGGAASASEAHTNLQPSITKYVWQRTL